jgi:protein-S-isoprenylcysteine O-methyltransferase
LSEAFLAFTFNRDLFSARRSFLISTPYVLAMLVGLAEYAVEFHLDAELKTRSGAAFLAFVAGAVLVATGELIRKLAVATAGRAFTHDIQASRRVPRVVQHGVYAWCRHPGYFGWLLWAPGTMLLLANPLSAALFALLAWRFFAARIPHEERLLRGMYGEEYEGYARRVPTRIWGIR